MSKKPFEPVTFTIDILQPDRQNFRTIEQYETTPDKPRAEVEQMAYRRAAELCEQAWPGQWVYAHGDLDKGDYDGQFQFIDGLGGSLVPASVRVNDPEQNRKRDATDRKRLKAREGKDQSFDGAVVEAFRRVNLNPALAARIAAFDGEGGFMFGWRDAEWDAIEKSMSSTHTFFGDASGAAWGMFMRQLQYNLRNPIVQPVDEPTTVDNLDFSADALVSGAPDSGDDLSGAVARDGSVNRVYTPMTPAQEGYNVEQMRLAFAAKDERWFDFLSFDIATMHDYEALAVGK